MGFEYAEVPSDALALIDKLVEDGRKCSPNGRVETDYDWRMVKKLWVYYTKAQPKDYAGWKQEMKKYREAYKDNKYHVKEEGSGFFKHTLEIPLYFYNILHSFFPNQLVEEPKFYKRFITEVDEARMSKDHHKI